MNQLIRTLTKTASVCSLILSSTVLHAQELAYAWGATFSGNGVAYANGMVVDADGNTYTVGNFQGTRDFDPGAGVATCTAAGGTDAFVCKLNAAGKFVWLKQLGGNGADVATAIALDSTGSLFITGTVTGTVDFDPGPDMSKLSPWGAPTAYLWKLDADGNYIWARQTAGASVTSNAVALDAKGNIYITGRYNSEQWSSFRSAAGTAYLRSAGGNDVYVQKLTSDGLGIWVKRMGGMFDDMVSSMAVDKNGNVYTTGFFLGAADYDPGPETAVLTSNTSGAVFISKLDTDGNYVWAKQLAASYGNSIKCDATGNVYVTGLYAGAVDFDPGDKVAMMKAAGASDAFVCKLDAEGNYNWARSMGGVDVDGGQALALDAAGNVYTTGYFKATADFDPGEGTALLTATSASHPDMFVSKLDAAGNFIFAQQLGDSQGEEGWDIATDLAGNVYTIGYSNGAVNWERGARKAMNAATGTGLFVNKLTSGATAPLLSGRAGMNR